MFNVNNKDISAIKYLLLSFITFTSTTFFHFRNLFLNFQLFLLRQSFFFFSINFLLLPQTFFFTSGNFFFTSNFLFHFQLFLLTQTFFYFSCGTYQCHFYPTFTILLRFSYYTISPNMGIQGA